MSTVFDEMVCRRDGADLLPPHVVVLIRERRRRLAAISRYDRYIARAAGHLTLQGFWRDLKRQDVEDAQRLKNRIDWEIADGDRTSMSQHEITALRPGLVAGHGIGREDCYREEIDQCSASSAPSGPGQPAPYLAPTAAAGRPSPAGRCRSG